MGLSMRKIWTKGVSPALIVRDPSTIANSVSEDEEDEADEEDMDEEEMFFGGYPGAYSISDHVGLILT